MNATNAPRRMWSWRVPGTMMFIHTRASLTRKGIAQVLALSFNLTWRENGETVSRTWGTSLTWFGETKIIAD